MNDAITPIILDLLRTPEIRDELQAILCDRSTVAPSCVNAPSTTSAYLTVQEYADHRRVGRTTVFEWIAKGLPSVKQGRGRVIDWRQADEFLDAGWVSLAKHKQVKKNKKAA